MKMLNAFMQEAAETGNVCASENKRCKKAGWAAATMLAVVVFATLTISPVASADEGQNKQLQGTELAAAKDYKDAGAFAALGAKSTLTKVVAKVKEMGEKGGLSTASQSEKEDFVTDLAEGVEACFTLKSYFVGKNGKDEGAKAWAAEVQKKDAEIRKAVSALGLDANFVMEAMRNPEKVDPVRVAKAVTGKALALTAITGGNLAMFTADKNRTGNDGPLTQKSMRF